MNTSTFSHSNSHNLLVQAFIESPQGRRCCVAFKQTRIGSDHLMLAVRDEVLDNLPALAPDRNWTAQELCGQFLWNLLDHPGLHRAMGLGLSFLVSFGVLPLVCVNPHAKGTKRYRIKPTA